LLFSRDIPETYKNIKESIDFVNTISAHDPELGNAALARMMGIALLDKLVVRNNPSGDIVTMLTVTVCRQQVSGCLSMMNKLGRR
jgi:hypothetical protein